MLDFREGQANIIREMAGLTCSSPESSATSSATAAAANDKPPHPNLRSNSHENSAWVGSRPRHGDGRLMSRETIIETEELELAKALSLSAEAEQGVSKDEQGASKDEQESASTSETDRSVEKENEHTPYLDVSLAMPYVSDMTEDEEVDLAMALSASRAESMEANKGKDNSENVTTAFMTQERPSGTTVDWREHSRGLTLRHRADETKDSDI